MDKSAVLTVSEVAALLRICEKTVYSLAREGALPCFKAGGQWRFRQAEIERWSRARSDVPIACEAQAEFTLPIPAPETGREAAPAHTTTGKTASLGFEDKLWLAADVLRNNMDPAEFKHVVLGLLFLKFVSDAFEEQRQTVRRTARPDAASAKHVVFWVPEPARWHYIEAHASSPMIGAVLDKAMESIERDNATLRDALPKVFARPTLDQHKLGELVRLFSGIGVGRTHDRDKDTLGRAYEYLLARFASAEGRGGGEFYTPTSVVRVLVEMLQPYEGRVYDPCCGSGGMFVQSIDFITAHGGRRDAVSIFGQESNPTTWRIARMNLAIRGIAAALGERSADTFHDDLHAGIRADFILANPPFNISNWGGDRLTRDLRWRFGTPPPGNANYAWLQHIIHHLSPTGTAGVVLANGSMSSQQSGEHEIRRRLIEADVVECMVSLPGQLFYSTQIPVCLWILTRNKGIGSFRQRKGEVLFIDARRLGRMETRVHRVLEPEDIRSIASTYHSWRGVRSGYTDVPGFCRSTTVRDIAAHQFILTPGRYVGAQHLTADAEPFRDKMDRLVTQLSTYSSEARILDARIADALAALGFEA